MTRSLLYIRTLVIGSLGGVVGHLLGLPLGWLLGAMVATVPCAIAGMSMPSSSRLRSVMIAVIGLMVGGAFTPETVQRAPEWVFSLAGVAIYVLLITALGLWICRVIGRQNRVNSAFSSLPGGLSEMLILGPALGADIRNLSLVHGMRVAIILFTVPAVVTSLGFQAVASAERSIDFSVLMPWRDAVILIACLGFGVVLGRLLRFPAANLTGPLLLSAIAHLAEWTTASPPQLVVIAAQVVIGVTVARYFIGIGWRQLVAGVAMGGGLTVVSLLLAALFAMLFQWLLGIPFAMAFMALVPGGLPEMSLVSISLGIDPAFISLHHLFRVTMILVLAPILIPRWVTRDSAKACEEQRE